ncbi:MAG: FAD-binding oxidoreductase [Rhodospirillaceae bacterium]|jgi:FAD/FMN-containing dehydrogenase|nr:FAD-binding oxidoreductase [Rhodospirillaceae bacterium]MBT5809179.1 FAD-binding oxidoreductase [Rhodospirillaceae bacterium]
MNEQTVNRLKDIVGPKGWIDAPDDMAPYLVDVRNLYQGAARLILRPEDTAQVAAIVKECATAGITVTPQGGNTGYCGGATPGIGDNSAPGIGDNSTSENRGDNTVLLCLSRMNRVRDIDPLNYTITVEAGCILADIQQAAAEADRLFPLSLAAEGTCQIGGNLSTNAGGTAVLRYGNTRDLVLGVEVVLPDGQIWDGMKRLRKNNTGYDLKQMFMGAEGTLGVITAAVLKLFPMPREKTTMFVALANPEAAVTLLARLRAASGDGVTTFEYLHRLCLELAVANIPGAADPFDQPHAHYALVELSSGVSDGRIAALAEDILGEAFEAGEVADAVVAASGQQAAQLWKIRESIPEAMNHEGGVIRHDVSVPVSSVPEFLDIATQRTAETIEGVRIAPFGHIGDGNIHFNLVQPEGADRTDFLARTHEIETVIHDIATGMSGSFSAEHGIGRLKRGELARYKSDVELDLFARVKAALDPDSVMNPGKVL